MSVAAVGVVGGGAWGTALAQVLASDGREVLLWAREADVVEAVNAQHRNPRFLPGSALHPSIRATGALADLAALPVLLLVTPAQHLGTVLGQLAPQGADVVLCAKGIEQGTGRLMSDVAAAAAPGAALAVLSGPTFAHEVADGLPTAVTLACAGGEAQWARLAPVIARPAFRPYYSADMIGASIGGAVKNVLAISCGVVQGLGLGANARAALISRGFAEMQRLGLAMGAEAETLAGLSGLGDLVLTCSSSESRNFALGMALGAEGDETGGAAALLAGRSTVAEGAFTAPVLASLAKERGIAMPIAEGVAALLDGTISPRALVAQLLARPLRAEIVRGEAPLAEAVPLSTEQQDIAALAKGGRTNFLGFLLRLAARIPFLFIAGRLYGAEDLGRFASATIAVELAAQLATLGQKRGLAQQLANDDRDGAAVVADALLLSGFVSAVLAALLYMFPAPMFPSGHFTPLQRLLPLTIVPLALGDIALAALAYRFDVGATVRARSVVEPWTLSIVAGLVWLAGVTFMPIRESGLILAYVASIFAATLTAFVPLLRSYGVPRLWSPRPIDLLRLAGSNLPLAGADAVEWGTRKLDLFLLGVFQAPPAVVGIYYVAQQVATLPQKLKTSFEPILGPVITRNLQTGNFPAVARQVCQVGFWIIAAQAGVALALGIPGAAVMGLVGPGFVAGTAALALLLAAEVAAATAVVSEAALIYIARVRNLWISLGTIALQAALTVGFMLAARRAGLDPLMQAAGAAAALAIALGCASLAKSWLLGSLLGERISNWRWPLLWAAAPAVLVGALMKLTPEWVELAIGIPAILAVYGAVIWRRGFGPEDRILFRKQTL